MLFYLLKTFCQHLSPLGAQMNVLSNTPSAYTAQCSMHSTSLTITAHHGSLNFNSICSFNPSVTSILQLEVYSMG